MAKKKKAKSAEMIAEQAIEATLAESSAEMIAEQAIEATLVKSQAFLARLDPLLVLGAMNADVEVLAPTRFLAASDPREWAGDLNLMESELSMPRGMASLSAQMSAPALQEFLKEDRVPLLVDVSKDQRPAVARKIESLGGTSEPITATTLLVQGPRKKLRDLAQIEGVRYVEKSYQLQPHCDLAHISSGLIDTGVRSVPQTGKGVLIGVIDTGIDVAHPAFRTGAGTRLIHYLDQTNGSAYTSAQINAGLAAGSPDLVGHGTHVAGIAAGNGTGSPAGVNYAGVAPEADIAAVKTTFATDKIADAVRHLFDLAVSRNQPCVVNLSLGGHFGGHDGSTVAERTIDQLSGPGRLVVVSAGNEGHDQIHAGTVLSPTVIPANPARWVANFSLSPRMVKGKQVGSLYVQVWHQHEDSLTIAVRAPNGESFRPPQNGQDQLDRTVFFIQGSHQIAPYSSDNVTTFTIITDPSSQWTGGWSLIVDEVRQGNSPGVVVGPVHAWIHDREMGAFTSGASSSYLVGMPGTAFSAITVASYATKRNWTSRDPNNINVLLNSVNLEDISYFSSPGPTRDGVNKPDVSAPGQWLVAPLAATARPGAIPLWTQLAGSNYTAMQGTSMAAPYVTGALALLLEKDASIEYGEARRRLIASARQDAFTKQCWNSRWGYGKINIHRLLGIEP